MFQLDAFDRAILAILQLDAALSYAEVGERVHLSASATLRRVQRMRESGTIIGTRVIVQPEHVGYPLTIIVEVTLENEHVSELTKIRQALVNDPQVQHCYCITGDTDLLLILAMPNMAAYKKFTDHHFVGNNNIKKFKTSVSMECVKSTTIYPV